MGYVDDGTEWKFPMRGGEAVHIEYFTAGGGTAVKLVRIKRGNANLKASSVEITGESTVVFADSPLGGEERYLGREKQPEVRPIASIRRM
jgi:hypothetical protein